MGCPRHDPDRRVRLRVGRLPNRLRSRVKRLPSFIDRRFAFAAELSDTAFALAIPRRHRVTQCGLGRRDGWRHP